MLGADWTRGRWTAGLIVSHSVGEGGYSGAPGAGDNGAQKLTSERVHGLTHPQLRLLERLGTRVRAKLLVTDCDHLGDRLGDPGRHAGKIDGRGCPRAGH